LNRLSRTLSVYLVRQFAVTFAAVLGVIVGLILLFDMIELLRRTTANERAQFGELLSMALLKMPHTVQDTLPFVVLVAMMFALFRLARTHELVVMRSAGVSVWQVLGPPLAAVALIGAVNLLLFNPVAAELYDRYQRREDALVQSTEAALNITEGGLWLREARDDTAIIVHATQLRQESGVLYLRGVTIFVTDRRDQLSRRYEAPAAEIRSSVINLERAWEMAPGENSQFHETLALPSSITPEKVQESFASPESMSIWTLPAFIRFSRESGFSVLAHRLYWQSLLASPFMLLAMVIVASAFCLSAGTRAGAWTLRAIGGLAGGFLFYFFNRFTYALGLSATLPLALAAWAPIAVASLLALAYLFQREDG
jgi:lipopolysaccharide export system permease protein